MIKAILFDFNGVVIDDEPIHFAAYKEVFEVDGIDLTEEKYYSCMGMSDEVFVKTIYNRESKSIDEVCVKEIIEQKTEKWRKQISEDVPLFDGVFDFIKRMNNEFSLGLVSMARREEIDFVFEKTGLAKSFSVIVSAEDISTTKPDPECYRVGFRNIDRFRTARGEAPLVRSECVVIEDSPQGVIAGVDAGLQTLGVTNTVLGDNLRAAGAVAVTDDLADWSPDSFHRVFR